MAVADERRSKRATMWSNWALLSNFGVAVALALILWGQMFERMVPAWFSPLHSMGTVGVVAVVYLALQFYAAIARRVGNTGAATTDMVMSFLPIVTIAIYIGIQFYKHGFFGVFTDMTPQQIWIAVIFLLTSVADVVVSSKASFTIMFLGNDITLN